MLVQDYVKFFFFFLIVCVIYAGIAKHRLELGG